jgi:hypothetical protein
VANLNEALTVVREGSRAYQQRLVAERMAGSAQSTVLTAGTLVLVQLDAFVSKLQPRFEGSFKVVKQYKNDITLRSLLSDSITVVHSDKLKLFFGTREEAIEMAKLDRDEFTVDTFLAYRGDPMLRSSMEFLVRFADGDGDEVWLPWSKDLFDTIPYETFCNSRVELRPLLVPEATARRNRTTLLSTQISKASDGDVVYVDLRTYGANWYATLPLPDKDRITYYLKYVYGKHNSSRTRIRCVCPLFHEHYYVDRDFVQRYGLVRQLPQDGILIDSEFVERFPMLKPQPSHDITMATGILRLEFLNYPSQGEGVGVASTAW